MAVFCPLFSGSSGNSEYIGYGDRGILIDAGVSAKRLADAMLEHGFNPTGIAAIFITHEHTDHICGLRVFAKKFGIPVFCSPTTKLALFSDKSLADQVTVNGFEHKVEISGFIIHRFATSHDCPGSSGYAVTTPDGKRMAVCTDLGYISDEVSAALTGCELVLLESNHDTSMLRNGPYPFVLKQRIASDRGHLSNACCGDELTRLVGSGTTRIILGHISKENNRPKLAYDSAVSFLSLSGYELDRDYTLDVAPPTGGKTVVI